MLAWDPPGVIHLPGPKVSLEKFLGQWFSNVRMQRYHLEGWPHPQRLPSKWGLALHRGCFFLSFPGDHNWESKLRTTGEPDLGFLAQKKPVLFLSLTCIWWSNFHLSPYSLNSYQFQVVFTQQLFQMKPGLKLANHGRSHFKGNWDGRDGQSIFGPKFLK